MRRPMRGFTLLELLVVLVVLGLAAAVATPSLVRLVDRLGERNEQDQLSLYLQNLPVAVMRQGGEYRVPATAGYVPAREALAGSPVELPPSAAERLLIWVPGVIHYRPNGACTGGTLYWELNGGRRVTHQLDAPLCRPRVEI